MNGRKRSSPCHCECICLSIFATLGGLRSAVSGTFPFRNGYEKITSKRESVKKKKTTEEKKRNARKTWKRRVRALS